MSNIQYNTATDFSSFSRSDRLGLTVFSSILVHMVIILGISFTVPKILQNLENLKTLSITLVNSRSLTKPEQADYISQANQDGGGEVDSPEIARSPLPAKLSAKDNQQLPVAAKHQRQRDTKPRDELIAVDDPQARLPNEIKAEPDPQVEMNEADQKGIIAQVSSVEQAQLMAAISENWQQYQKRPRRKFLSARTRESIYAEYIEGWRIRTEKVGKLNYPGQASRQRTYGKVLMNIAIRSNGSLEDVAVQRSSGHAILDDAAVRIVRLSAPYREFPEAIKKETDILHITRTFEFTRRNRLHSF